MPIPTCRPADLDAEAQALYRRALDSGGGYADVAEADAAAAAELVAANLATVVGVSTLWPARLHPQFTVARGGLVHRSLLYAEVSVVRRGYRGQEELLGCLDGATLVVTEDRDTRMPTWRLAVVHQRATDEEHDAIVVAEMGIDHPVVTDTNGQRQEAYGHLHDLRLWPAGTDPLADAVVCTSCHPPHLTGAKYCPPRRPETTALDGALVCISWRSMALVDEGGRPLSGEFRADDPDPHAEASQADAQADDTGAASR